MLHILIHVSLQNSIKRSKQPHKAVSVNCCNFKLCRGNDISCTWLTFEQSSFSKVVSWAILFDLLRLRSGAHAFSCDSVSTYDQVEVITFVTLCDNTILSLELLLFDCIGNFTPLIVIHTLQNGH